MGTKIYLGKPPASIEQWIKDHHGPSLNSPLCFTAVDAGATITFNKVGSPDDARIVYATESPGQRAALDWKPYTFNNEVILANVGDKVYFRAADENDISFYKSPSAYYRFATPNEKKIAASGNIQTLMKADGSRLDISGKTFCYAYMFQSCTSLTAAPSLAAMTLAGYCYQYMFSGCSSLTTAPALPATALARNCYEYMFSRCKSLTSAPALPATALAGYCYSNMFSGCSSLTTAPELPATTLAERCYIGMFSYCSSLTTAPELPATILVVDCYSNMFYSCTSLTTAPTLPAMTLAGGCYASMFQSCTSLTTAPSLPATTLANYCYSNMFSGCSSLVQPSFPAYALAENCYQSMVFDCSQVQEITFDNLYCGDVAQHAWEWGIGIDRNYNKFLVVAYCKDGVVVINDDSGSSS